MQKCINALQQVTARDGRPIVICERGDVETQKYASQFIEVPHTVDCLQVNFEPYFSRVEQILIFIYIYRES